MDFLQPAERPAVIITKGRSKGCQKSMLFIKSCYYYYYYFPYSFIYLKNEFLEMGDFSTQFIGDNPKISPNAPS